MGGIYAEGRNKYFCVFLSKIVLFPKFEKNAAVYSIKGQRKGCYRIIQQGENVVSGKKVLELCANDGGHDTVGITGTWEACSLN